MSKINWKLRLKNKTTLLSLVTLIVSFIYTILATFDVVPGVSENEVVNVLTLIIQVLSAVGIVVDPTTSGISDSSQAMEYENPREG